MASALTYLDGYCERAGDPALFAEPLNAVTNLFFILAALCAARAILQLPSAPMRQHLDSWLLVAALFAIGIGSGLWHLMPSGTTVLMDVIPITLFILIYLIAAMRRILGYSWKKTACWWAVYIAFTLLTQRILPPDLFNGTIMYIPTYLTLAALTFAIVRKDKTIGRTFLCMLGLWTLSLTFRTMDPEICAWLPIGTHFLWHTLNAWMLFRFIKVLIETSRIQ